MQKPVRQSKIRDESVNHPMTRSIYPAEKRIRAHGGRFLTGKYTPARRSPGLPVVHAATRRAPTSFAIPHRASAYPANIVRVHSRYTYINDCQGEAPSIDVTRVPTLPRNPSVPVATTATVATVVSAESIMRSSNRLAGRAKKGELGLNQPLEIEKEQTLQHQAYIDKTGIYKALKRPALTASERSLVTARPPDVSEIETFPPLLTHIEVKKRFQPVEQIRWWLLQPGRLEFLLWLCGTIILIGVTSCMILFICISLGYISLR